MQQINIYVYIVIVVIIICQYYETKYDIMFNDYLMHN